MKGITNYIDFSGILSDLYKIEKWYMLECIENKNKIIHLEDESEENLLKTQEIFKNIINAYDNILSQIEGIDIEESSIDFEDKTMRISFWEESLTWETIVSSWYSIWIKIDFSNWEDQAFFSDYVYEGF